MDGTGMSGARSAKNSQRSVDVGFIGRSVQRHKLNRADKTDLRLRMRHVAVEANARSVATSAVLEC